MKLTNLPSVGTSKRSQVILKGDTLYKCMQGKRVARQVAIPFDVNLHLISY